jgi:hypothetical protein
MEQLSPAHPDAQAVNTFPLNGDFQTNKTGVLNAFLFLAAGIGRVITEYQQDRHTPNRLIAIINRETGRQIQRYDPGRRS